MPSLPLDLARLLASYFLHSSYQLPQAELALTIGLPLALHAAWQLGELLHWAQRAVQRTHAPPFFSAAKASS
jgi:hypothetical protein